MALPLVAGALPDGLRGHFFVLAPVSTVAWGGRPRAGQPSLLNGDGLCVRVDFDGAAARASSRLMRTPDFIADQRTHDDPKLAAYKFYDAGIARLSPRLGARNFLNTALVPMCRPGEPPRLLVTYDAGRPFEIDPLTLEVVSAVGAAREWRAETFDGQPFPMILSPGHPAYDPATGELYTVNYGRSLGSMLTSVRLSRLLARLPRPLRRALAAIQRVGARLGLWRAVTRALGHFWRAVDAVASRLVGRGAAALPATFTDLVRWDGAGPLQRFRLALSDDKDVAIQQSVHQVAVTRHHVVILDTAFRVGFEQWFNDPVPSEHSVEELARLVLARPQLPETILYLVRRADLASAPAGGRVRARRVTIPVEAGHLLADYDDDGDRVTVHLAHSPATDLAEWIRPYDVNFFDGAPAPAELQGFLAVGAMDVNRLGRYTIDAVAGRVTEAHTVADDAKTWAVALYAARGVPALDGVPARLSSLYWTSEGFFPELLTRFVHDLYARYPHRQTPLAEIARLTDGRPSCLLRLDTATMQLADAHVLPGDSVLSSPQFIPRAGGAGDTDGWIVAAAFTPARAELWIYDAARLSDGPLARLDASALGAGFSLHTAWLPAIAARTAPYRVSDADAMGAPLPPDFADRV